MARPRAFDETAVLDAAIECFWTHGYEATSVRVLADDMGINGASMYNAFGDKRSLYLRALDRYLDQSVRDRITRLEGALPPREAIAAFFAEIIERSLSDPLCRGCMLVNAALEVGPQSPELRMAIAEELAQIEGFFSRCVQAGQRAGDIAGTLDADDAGRLFLSVLMGLRVLARTRPERSLLEGIVRPALATLDRPGRSTAASPRRPSRPRRARAG